MAPWRLIQYPSRTDAPPEAIAAVPGYQWQTHVPALPTLRKGLTAAVLATAIAVVPPTAPLEPAEAEEQGWTPQVQDLHPVPADRRYSYPSVFYDTQPVTPAGGGGGLVLRGSRTFRRWQYQATFEPVPVAPLVFDPATLVRAPDPIPGRLGDRTAQVPSVFFDPTPVFDPADLSWTPVVPDRFRVSTLPVAAQPVVSRTPVQIDPATGFAWPLPAEVIRPLEARYTSPAVAFGPDPTDVPATAENRGWVPTYPDWLEHRVPVHPEALSIDPYIVAFDPALLEIPHPAEVIRPVSRISTDPSVFADAQPIVFDPAELGWGPHYPAQHLTPAWHAERDLFVFFDPLSIPNPPRPLKPPITEHDCPPEDVPTAPAAVWEY